MKYVPRRGSPWTLKVLRERAFREQGGLCYWCRQPMKLGADAAQNEPLACTGDHVVPRYAGGLTKPGNIVAACVRCNTSRQTETNMPRRDEAVFTAGDIAPISPFASLKRGD